VSGNGLIECIILRVWKGCDSIMRTRVFSDRLLSGQSGVELCYQLPSWDMSCTFHGEVRGGECHESRDLRTSNGGSSLCIDAEFA
jgi:hypothetical protein